MGKPHKKQSSRRRGREALSTPGAYVQVMNAPRRRDTIEESSAEGDDQDPDEALPAAGLNEPGPGHTGRYVTVLAPPDAEEPVEPPSVHAADEASDGHAPLAALAPNFASDIGSIPASVLDAGSYDAEVDSDASDDAAHSKTPWATVLGVAALSSIIVAAGVVALREQLGGQGDAQVSATQLSPAQSEQPPVENPSDKSGLAGAVTPTEELAPPQLDPSTVSVAEPLEPAPVEPAEPAALVAKPSEDEPAVEPQPQSAPAKTTVDSSAERKVRAPSEASAVSTAPADKAAKAAEGESAAEEEPAMAGAVTMRADFDEPLSTTAVPVPAATTDSLPDNPYGD